MPLNGGVDLIKGKFNFFIKLRFLTGDAKKWFKGNFEKKSSLLERILK